MVVDILNNMVTRCLTILLIFNILLTISDSKFECPSEINVDDMLCSHDMKLQTELPELKLKTKSVATQLRRLKARFSNEVKREVYKVCFCYECMFMVSS